MKRKIIIALAALGIMASALTAAAPNALAATETRTGWTECGNLPAKLHVDMTVVKNLTNNNRTVTVRGYGIGYNGYKYQVSGPRIWQFEGLIYNRTALMTTSGWYGKTVTGISFPAIDWDARIYSGSATCDVFVRH